MLDIRRFDSGIIGILNVCIYNVLSMLYVTSVRLNLRVVSSSAVRSAESVSMMMAQSRSLLAEMVLLVLVLVAMVTLRSAAVTELSLAVTVVMQLSLMTIR